MDVQILAPARPGDHVLRIAGWIAMESSQRLEAIGHSVDLVAGVSCTEALLCARPPPEKGLVYVGHGWPERIQGSDERGLFPGDAAQRVRGLWVHLFACQTAWELGPRLITAGARVYVGYKLDLTPAWDERTLPEPLRPLMQQLVACATLALAEHAEDERAIRARMLPAVDAVVAWCDRHPGQAPNLGTFASELYDGLVVLTLAG